MRWLEGTPERYDAGMRALSLGRVAQLHAAVADAAARKPGDRVLEIGCGTGAVTALLVARGAQVTAIDQSPEMLEQARRRLPDAAVDWREQTAAEIDVLPEAAFEAVVLCLCLSDMSSSERRFVLEEAALRLAEGGLLVAADELHAPPGWRRALQTLSRMPQAVLGWLLVGSISRPLPDLRVEIAATQLRILGERRWLFGTLGLYVAERS
jgi:ubiquinone/menaquinone biosynthesis C-methylase UbiE